MPQRHFQQKNRTFLAENKKKNLVSVENDNGQNRHRLLVSTPKMNFRQSLSLASSAVWAEKQRTANTTTR